MLARARVKNREAKKHKIATAAFSSNGPFDCVVIDPPWPMRKIDRDDYPNQDAFDYPTMSEDELTAFWAKRSRASSRLIAMFYVDDAGFLPVALRLLKIVVAQVCADNGVVEAGRIQPVGLPQYNMEFVIYARKGSPIFIDTKDFNCGFQAARREHSRKPDYFYDLVRRVTGGSRIDVFSREKREGFAQYGNELDRFTRPTALSGKDVQRAGKGGSANA